jgi:hypothetical protein
LINFYDNTGIKGVVSDSEIFNYGNVITFDGRKKKIRLKETEQYDIFFPDSEMVAVCWLTNSNVSNGSCSATLL